jgi:hypothetical protein
MFLKVVCSSDDDPTLSNKDTKKTTGRASARRRAIRAVGRGWALLSLGDYSFAEEGTGGKFENKIIWRSGDFQQAGNGSGVAVQGGTSRKGGSDGAAESGDVPGEVFIRAPGQSEHSEAAGGRRS